MARKLREEGLSLNQIGVRLRKEGLTPLRGGKWHPAQVAKLLTDDARYDRMAISRRASDLRAQGLTLKEIGFRLSVEGFKPKEGGVWYPSLVHSLLASEEGSSPKSVGRG